ncbi:unnamed protein product [Sphacelaria rigidula]
MSYIERCFDFDGGIGLAQGRESSGEHKRCSATYGIVPLQRDQCIAR